MQRTAGCRDCRTLQLLSPPLTNATMAVHMTSTLLSRTCGFSSQICLYSASPPSIHCVFSNSSPLHLSHTGTPWVSLSLSGTVCWRSVPCSERRVEHWADSPPRTMASMAPSALEPANWSRCLVFLHAIKNTVKWMNGWIYLYKTFHFNVL